MNQHWVQQMLNQLLCDTNRKANASCTTRAKTIVVDAAVLVSGWIDVTSKRTQENKVWVMNAPKKTNNDAIHQTGEWIVVALHAGTFDP